MKRIKLLAKLLDSEATEVEMQAPQKYFTDGLDFWQLCLEAKRLLLEEQQLKWEKKNDKNRPR